MTIYALSTGPGVSGVAIVRISGPEASIAIKLLTKKDLPTPRIATLRKIYNINKDTFSNNKVFFSHRRESQKFRDTGRMLNIIAFND